MRDDERLRSRALGSGISACKLSKWAMEAVGPPVGNSLADRVPPLYSRGADSFDQERDGGWIAGKGVGGSLGGEVRYERTELGRRSNKAWWHQDHEKLKLLLARNEPCLGCGKDGWMAQSTAMVHKRALMIMTSGARLGLSTRPR